MNRIHVALLSGTTDLRVNSLRHSSVLLVTPHCKQHRWPVGMHAAWAYMRSLHPHREPTPLKKKRVFFQILQNSRFA